MKSDKTVQEFVVTIEQRLYESSKFWADCDSGYQDINDFTSSLNALIQSLRNLTFIVQSHKATIPDFDRWYISKQEEMKNDPYLKWAHQSRNTIVKVSNLKLKSKTTVDLLNWEAHPLLTIEVDPLNNNTKIVEGVLSQYPDEELVKRLRDPLVRIERFWIADNLPDKELLWLTAYCYRYLKNIIIEIYDILNLNKQKVLSGFEKDINILNKESLFEGKRTTVLKLKDKNVMTFSSRRVKADKNAEKFIKKRYGFTKSQIITKGDKFLNDLEMLTENAKKIIKVDGHHYPFVFVYDQNDNSEMSTHMITDRAELYYSIRKIADSIVKKRSQGIIIINESWIRDRRTLKIKGECINVAAVRKDFFELRSINFKRSGNQIEILQTEIMKDKNGANYLKPIFEAFEAVNPTSS